MKLSSPRTWLIVAAGVLLIAGGVVLYVVKNPPLPPGWEWHEGPRFRVALPPRDRWFSYSDEGVTVGVGAEGLVSVYLYDHNPEPGQSPAEALEAHFKLIVQERHLRVTVRERFETKDGPGIIHDFEMFAHSQKNIPIIMPWRRMMLLAKGRIYHVDTTIIPGDFSAADADLLFRTFRPK